jgi:hypothetical protein
LFSMHRIGPRKPVTTQRGTEFTNGVAGYTDTDDRARRVSQALALHTARHERIDPSALVYFCRTLVEVMRRTQDVYRKSVAFLWKRVEKAVSG